MADITYTARVTDAAGQTVVRTVTATTTTAPGTWPNSTNTGHRNAPGYPGTLTPFSGALSANTTYSFRDFSGGVTITASNVTFIGCRFRNNWVDGWNVKTDHSSGTSTFRYCTFEPSSGSIPNPAWPSAGAGKDVDGTTGGGFEPYMLAHNLACQYGLFNWRGAILVENCDLWGWGNSIPLFGTWQKTIRNCWIHDAAAEGTGSGMYHQDGPGHLDGGGVSNVLIEGNTIASLGNTNGIAFQAASGGYRNIVVRNNYLSGFGFCVDMCHNATGNTGLEFTNNVIATDIAWHWGPIYTNFTSQFSQAANLWRGNKLRVMPGTKPRNSSNNKFTSLDDGKFVLPSGAYSTTDFE